MRAFEDRSCRAAVFVQDGQRGIGELSLKQFERAAGGTAEAIDSLIGVADRENILGSAGQLLQNFDLGKIGVLEFVNKNEFGAGALALQQHWIFRKKFIGA